MTTMIEVPAVQYMRPDGRRVDVMARIPAELEPVYNELTERGCRLAGEVLLNGMVSLTIEHPEGDFAIEVVPNDGPKILDATRRLLERWSSEAFDTWLASVREGDTDA